MPKLIFFTNMTLDGYIADKTGNFDWGTPDQEQHQFINDFMRPAAIHLYGRRNYEIMTWWDDPANIQGEPPVVQDFAAIWQNVDKVVYSRTLEAVTTDRTRLEREFDPAAVRAMKETASNDIFIGGPTLAAHALRAGIVDEIILFVAPVTIGNGLSAFPPDHRMNLDLLEEQRFGGGKVYLRYAVKHD